MGETEVIWKRWTCPICREEDISDPNYIYVTCCGKGHVCLLGHAEYSGQYVWAEIDQTAYTIKEIRNFLKVVQLMD